MPRIDPTKFATACEHTDRLLYSRGVCKPCYNTRLKPPTREQRDRYQATFKGKDGYTAIRRGYILKKKYNITLEQYDAILLQQNGVCAICFQLEERVQQNMITPLVVDHNHSTGEVRGLLCHRCNMAISKAEQDLSWIENARAYLTTGRSLLKVSETLER